ncbi:N-acetylneuraminate synthase [Pseudomonas sp. M47T1]|uniref:pseudaminic acid synthase n=1 Tax=Pseudomonas sp. M47T1 TaxID=1179778 RepID=UPI0002608648|nr:pseudaminic acid synthase [Pseudomonas sp. M47T1]EIK93538.1 N-acetylneuraminate synthase [Pseudomonas sp. M47T1]
MPSFKIGHRAIGLDSPPFVIAEMSGNHNQSLERALAIVDAAAAAGAHALKLQTYTADTMTLDIDQGEFRISDPDSLWADTSLYALYEQAHTPWEWHGPIFERAKSHGMLGFSSPFDETAVDFLESLDVPAYKIASFENTDLPLIRKAASTGKPLIISTGMATVAELDESVRAARAAGCRELILLKCTSTYPASPLNTHLRTIAHMRELFGCEVGLSDHTMGVGAAVAAVALGASVVEKHFTLDRSAGGVDANFSLEPAELASLVTETERAWQALGHVQYGATTAEQKSLVYRRSLYVVRDVAAGEPLTRDNVRAIRPGLGLAPRHLDTVLGRAARRPLARGMALDWSMID